MSDDEEIKVGPLIAPGEHAAYRRRGEEIETGVVRTMKDGQPITEGAELVQVKTNKGCDMNCGGWHEAKSVYKNGPAQVATPKYRDGYDRIFGKKKEVGLA